MKKTNSKKRKEVEVYLPSGPIPVRALTNKQLIEVARYNNPTEEEKKNRKQNTNKVISSLVRPLSISGAIIGGSSRLHKGSRAVLKGAALGTAIGTGIGLASGITLKKLGHKHHKKAAEVAEDELKTRNKLGIVYAKPGEWPELDRSNAEYQNKKEKKIFSNNDGRRVKVVF